LTRVVFDLIESGRCHGVVSAIVVAEVLVRPYQMKEESLSRVYEHLFLTWPNLEVMSIDYRVAAEAARIRAAHSRKMPDSMILATARVAGATALVTNDRSLGKAGGPEIIVLDDYG